MVLMKWENGWQSAGAVTCTRGIPQGTENLPPGIINMLSDLYPRRLWGKPEEVLWTWVFLFWDGGFLDYSFPPIDDVRVWWNDFWDYMSCGLIFGESVTCIGHWIGYYGKQEVLIYNMEMYVLQDLPERPKYLLTLTVGVSQKEAVNQAVQKVSCFVYLLIHFLMWCYTWILVSKNSVDSK